jgi:hypothetical protein
VDREPALRARPANQTLFHYRAPDLGAAGHHRLGTVVLIVSAHWTNPCACFLKPFIHNDWSALPFPAPAPCSRCHDFPDRPAGGQLYRPKARRWWEKLLARIPVVNSVYNSVKQVSDTIFSRTEMPSARRLLVQYPRQGSWTIAFLTGKPGGDLLSIT